jgi:hypothetical protein
MNGLEKTVAAGLATVALFSAAGAAERSNPELNKFVPTPSNVQTFLGNRATDVLHTAENVINDPELHIRGGDGSGQHESYDGAILGLVETGFAGYLGARILGGLLRRRRSSHDDAHGSSH